MIVQVSLIKLRTFVSRTVNGLCFGCPFLEFAPNHTPLKDRPYPFKIGHYGALLMKLEILTTFVICNWYLLLAVGN